MPIKFRCKHCRQFLGISRSKAGSVVDCPTCGRSVRVPELDGSVEPIPDPKIDLNDEGLANALDQLASIGDIPIDELREDEDFPQPAQAPVQSVAPAPKPEPIPIEPPPPVEPIAPQPTATNVVSSETEENDPIGSLAGTGKSALASPSAGSSFLDAMQSVPVIATLVGMAILFFGLGLVIGKFGSSKKSLQSYDNASSNKDGTGTTSKNEATSTAVPALRGRITYETVSGNKREDRGARVIVFPAERKGSVKLSVAGFRAADTDADLEIAAATMKALGGAMTKVADDGTFDISLDKPGSYSILVISHFQKRDETVEIESSLQKLIETYFERTDQLLGKVSYHFGEFSYKGEGTQPWDYSFDRVAE